MLIKPLVELCAHNASAALEKKAEANEKWDIIVYGCLGNCGQCAAEPFALLEGDIVAAPTVEALEQLINDAAS